MAQCVTVSTVVAMHLARLISHEQHSGRRSRGSLRAPHRSVTHCSAVSAVVVIMLLARLISHEQIGQLVFRKIDNQLTCSAYFGQVTDDPKYNIPIYHNLLEIKGSDILRSEAEIAAARAK